MPEDIDERTLDKFLDAARSFYKTAYNFYRKWLPLNDPFFELLSICELRRETETRH